jgi:hypothetical protein
MHFSLRFRGTEMIGTWLKISGSPRSEEISNTWEIDGKHPTSVRLRMSIENLWSDCHLPTPIKKWLATRYAVNCSPPINYRNIEGMGRTPDEQLDSVFNKKNPPQKSINSRPSEALCRLERPFADDWFSLVACFSIGWPDSSTSVSQMHNSTHQSRWVAFALFHWPSGHVSLHLWAE